MIGSISAVLSSQYLAEAVFLLRGFVLARLVGPESFGVWSAMGLIRGYSRFAPLGVVQGMWQLMPRAIASGDRDSARMMQGAAVATGIVATAVVSLAIIGWAAFFLATDGARTLWFLFAGILLILQFFELHRAVLMAEQQFRLASAATVVLAFGSTMLGLAGAFYYGLGGFLAGIAVSHLAVAFFLLRYLRRPALIRPRAETTLRLMRTGLPLLATGLLQASIANVDKLLIWVVLGKTLLGIYSLPAYLITAVMMIPSAVTTVAYPRLLQSLERAGSAEPAQPYLEGATILLAHVACLVLAGLFLVFHLPVQWWLPEYADAVAPARIIFLVSFFPIVGALPSTVLISMNRQRQLIGIRSVVLLVSAASIGLALALGAGLTGVALATAPGLVLQTLLTARAALTESGIERARARRILLAIAAPYLVTIALLVLAEADLATGTLHTASKVLIIGIVLAVLTRRAAHRALGRR